MNRISDSRIVGRPLLDRCHADRNDDKANRARWDDPAAQLLLIDPYDKVVMAHDRVVAVPTEGERDDQHDLLLGVVDGVPWFTRRTNEPRPEARSVRAVDLVPVDRELVLSLIHI